MANGIFPAWLSHMLKTGEGVLNPSIDVFQGYVLPLGTVDGKLYHGSLARMLMLLGVLQIYPDSAPGDNSPFLPSLA